MREIFHCDRSEDQRDDSMRRTLPDVAALEVEEGGQESASSH